MANILVSFLGIGNPREVPGYKKALYSWEDKTDTCVEVHFAQTAVLKFLELSGSAEQSIDRVILFCTDESESSHRELLLAEMKQNLKIVPPVKIPEPNVPTNMSTENQWGWFEQLLGLIDYGDSLVIDFTHGMRAVPIVFSSAIGFLQRAKNIHLRHAIYAWYDPSRGDTPHPIIDMSEFYVINDWAESISRLIDDANAKELGRLAETSNTKELQILGNSDLVCAFDEMTDCIRNVDVNNVAAKVSRALDTVQAARKTASGSAGLMLDLVWEKFSGLAFEYPPSGYYDQAYFQSQLKIIEVLFEHKLYMQAYTAMRECIGSLGMVGVPEKYNKNMLSSEGRKRRRRFAEVFVNMLQYAENDWTFHGDARGDKEKLLTWYDSLKELGIEEKLRDIVKPMVDIRNGFDHAWTAKAGATPDIKEKGFRFLLVLQDVIQELVDKEMLVNRS